MNDVGSREASDIEGWDAIAEDYSEWLAGGEDSKGRAFTTIVTENTLRITGDVHQKQVLDLGCGDGYIARELAHRGAQVSGIDGAGAMIAVAKAKTHGHQIAYRVGDITKELPYEKDSFDLVICNMVLHDLENISMTVSEVARILRDKGKFVFSVVHPCFFSALGEWIDVTSDAPALRFKARYTEQIKSMKQLVGLTSKVVLAHYNRPIQDYVRSLIINRFCVIDFVETSFSREFLESEGLVKEFRHYYLTANNLIIGASKLPQ